MNQEKYQAKLKKKPRAASDNAVRNKSAKFEWRKKDEKDEKARKMTERLDV